MHTDDNTPGEDTADAQDDSDAPTEPETNPELVEPDDDSEDEGEPEGPLMYMGEPFAMAGTDGPTHNAQFLEENSASDVPGCFACLLCSCGQSFKMNLLPDDDAVQFCPNCKTDYTSVLVVGASDDGHVWPATMMYVFHVNGMGPNPDDDNEDDDDDSTGAGIPDAGVK